MCSICCVLSWQFTPSNRYAPCSEGVCHHEKMYCHKWGRTHKHMHTHTYQRRDTTCTPVYNLYTSIQPVHQYTACTPMYTLYTSIQLVHQYTVCTPLNSMYSVHYIMYSILSHQKQPLLQDMGSAQLAQYGHLVWKE